MSQRQLFSARVIGPGDVLFGKTVAAASMSSDALSDGELAFDATFSDGSSGIYIVPEPGSATIMLLGLLALCGRRRQA